MNCDVTVGLWPGSDREKAEIKLRSFGGVNELRVSGSKLAAVARISPADIGRLLEAFSIAEGKRIDPDARLLEALQYVRNRFDSLDEDQSQLWINCEMEMPIASCGSVLLKPNFSSKSAQDTSESDD